MVSLRDERKIFKNLVRAIPKMGRGGEMSKYNGKHDILYPIGNKESIICYSLGHNWQDLFCYDIHYRHSLRCERMERKKLVGN